MEFREKIIIVSQIKSTGNLTKRGHYWDGTEGFIYKKH